MSSLIPLLFSLPLLLASPVWAATGAGVFAETTPLNVELTARWSSLAQDKTERWWSLRAQIEGEDEVAGQVRARGMSSRWEGEGTFPKLRLKFDEDETGDTTWTDSPDLKLNPHVELAGKSERTQMGRIKGDLGPWREALAYDWAEAVGLPTHLHRRAWTTFREPHTKRVRVVRSLFLETDKSFAKRWGARVIEPEEFAREQRTRLPLEESARFHLFQALIGNKDYVLRVDQEDRKINKPLWACGNAVVIEDKKGRRRVAAYDFDLTTFVSGEAFRDEQWSVYPEFGLHDEVSSFLAWSLVSLKARHPRAAVEKALASWPTARTLEQIAKSAPIDDEGRAIALRHLRRFHQHLKPVLQWPVLAEPGVNLFRDPELRHTKMRPMPSGREPFLRPGTPIRVLEKTENFWRVAVFDFHWDLEKDEEPTGYIKPNPKMTVWLSEANRAWTDERDRQDQD